MSETKTHWKKTIDKDWIGTYVLPEARPIVVKLISVKYQEVKVKGVKDWYKVAYFAPNKYFDKPMLLSASKNLSRLEKLTGTPYIEDWEKLNLNVTLQQEMDKAFGGGKDWALRISEVAPRVKKTEILPDTDQWSNAIKHLKGKGDIKKITDRHTISELNLKRLQDESK